LENARYVMNNARSLGDEIQYKTDGFIQTRAQSVLDEAISLLEGVEAESLFSALEEGRFADVKRPRDRGKGRDGVFLRSQTYTNPVETHLRAGLGLAK
jgi:beta-lysine 5,6-aminomutase alpha subunit